MIARFINMALAVELFVAMLGLERNAQPTIFVGLFMVALIIAFEAMAFMDTRVRHATTAMGLLVIAQGLGLQHFYPWTRWHDAAIGALIVLFSLPKNREIAPDAPVLDEKQGGGPAKMSVSV
jgi:hypothetical protein